MIFGSESPEPVFRWTRKSAEVDQKVGLGAVVGVEAAVVDDDRAMPQWRMRQERQRNEPIPKRWDPHQGRRKTGRWKW